MIPPSEILCPVCGTLFREVCYGNEAHAHRLRLVRGGRGNSARLSLQPIPRKGPELSEEAELPEYIPESGTLDPAGAMPNAISVMINGGRAEQFQRCCPHCDQFTPLPAHWGTVPSFVVVTLGYPGEGKSSLLQALNVVENGLALSYSQPDILLKVPKLVDGDKLTARATPVDSKGNSVVVSVYGKGDLPVANVLFRDVAGEIFRSRDLKQYAVFNFFRAHGAYPGPDGFFLVHSAAQEDALLTKAYDYVDDLLRELGQPWPPTACVITHLDKITGSAAWTSPGNMGKRVTVLDEKTFPCCNAKWLSEHYYSSQRLIPRMILQDSLVRSHYSLLSSHFRALPKGRCFLVKSCSGQGTQQDFFQPINVMDPFIWILSQLRLIAVR